MLTLERVIIMSQENPISTKDGRVITVRPYHGRLLWRLKDALAVLCGNAEAVEWPENFRVREVPW